MRVAGAAVLIITVQVVLGAAPANPTLDLLTAARHGDVGAVRQALAAGAPIDGTDPDFAQTALIRATMFNQRAVVLALIAAKADPNKASNLKRTALHWAAAVGADGIIPALVAAGGRVDAGDAYDETPLGYAAQAGQPGAARALLAAGARVDRMKRPLARQLSLVLGNGIQGPPLDALIVIIGAGQGLEVQDDVGGQTPLVVAAEYAYRDADGAVTAALVRAGANRAVKNREGKTPATIVQERLDIEKDPTLQRNLRAALAALR